MIGVGVVHGQPADQVDGVLVGADLRLRAAQRDGQLADRAAFPPQDQAGVRVRVVAAGGDVHLLQQGAQQLLAVLIGGGRRVPDLAEVVAEGQDRGPLGRGEGLGPGGLAAGELGFGIGEPAAGRCSIRFPGRGRPAGCRGRRRGSGARPWWRCSGPARPGGGAGPARRRGLARAARRPAGRPAARPAGGRPGTPRRRRRRWPARRRSCAGRRGR